jgi:hypothetical protein
MASPPAPAIQGGLVSALGPDVHCGEGREVLKLAQGRAGTLAVRVLGVVPVPDILQLDHLDEPPFFPSDDDNDDNDDKEEEEGEEDVMDCMSEIFPTRT